jgi:hypothetical protein
MLFALPIAIWEISFGVYMIVIQAPLIHRRGRDAQLRRSVPIDGRFRRV